MIQITKSADWKTGASKSADAAARAVLAKIGSRKLRIIRLLEALLRPIVSLSNRSQATGSALNDEDVKGILVLEYWHLGDIVMQLPFLQNLRLHYPNAHIVLLASPKGAALITDRSIVDEIIVTRVPWAEHYSRWKKYNPFSKLWIDLHRTLRTLRARGFDLAFASRADLRDNFMLWFLNIRRRVGYSYGGGGLFLTDRVSPDLQNPHQSNRSLQLLRHLGKPVLEQQPHLHLSPEERREAKRLMENLGVAPGDFLVAVHPGARSPIRQWGQEHFAAVARSLRDNFQVKIVWFEDPQESQNIKDSQFLRLSLPLRKFMAVLSHCNLLICNDSGPMHIATALDVPVVAVFGPGEPAWFGPLGSKNQIVIRSGFWCRPCLDYCRFDEPYCIRTVQVEDVYAASEKAVRALLVELRDLSNSRPEEFVGVLKARTH